MVLQHIRVIHFIDVVTGQDDKVFGGSGAKDVEILVNCIRRAAVPSRLIEPLLGRQQVEKLVHLRTEERPAHLQMSQQAVRFVLGQDADPTDAGIEAVREGKVDNAELTAEKYGGLGAPVGQLLQP